MPKPDPKVFAEHVLWHLCGVRAHLREIETYLATEVSLKTPNPKETLEKIVLASKERREKLQQEMYDDAEIGRAHV